MAFREANEEYAGLLAALSAGTISRAAFDARTAAVRVTAVDGSTWTIDGQRGGWLRWDGSAWQPGTPLAEDVVATVASSSTDPAASAAARPETLRELFKMLWAALKKRLPLMIGAAVVIVPIGIIIHTWAMAALNDGFNPMDGGWIWESTSVFDWIKYQIVGMTVALQGRMVGGTLVWTLLSTLLGAAIATRAAGGGLLKGARLVPQTIGRAVSGSRGSAVVPMLAGVAASAALAAIFDNRLLALIWVVYVWIFIAGGPGGLPYLFVSCAHHDLMGAFKRPWTRLPDDVMTRFLVGVGAGAVVGVVLLFMPGIGWLVAFAAAVAAVIIATQKPGATAGAAAVLLLGLLFVGAHVAFGDDGGPAELGGWPAWWASGVWILQGAMGLPPTIGAALGLGLGWSLVDLGLEMPPAEYYPGPDQEYVPADWKRELVEPPAPEVPVPPVPVQPVPPADPLSGFPRSADGRVFMKDVPWDEAGEGWVSEGEARKTIQMRAEGKEWAGNTFGWVDKGEGARMEADRARRWQQFTTTRDPEIVAIEQRIRDAKAAAAAAAAEQKRLAIIDIKWRQLHALEEGQKATADIGYYNQAIIVAETVKTAADIGLAVTGGAAVAGGASRLLVHGIRLGYNFVKAGGEVVAQTGVSNVGVEALKETVKRGATNAAWDYGAEGAGKAGLWVAGKALKPFVPALKEVAGDFKNLVVPPKALPPRLISPNAALQQVTGGLDDMVRGGASIDDAAKTLDPGQLKALYQTGSDGVRGVDKLAELEAAGKISSTTRQVLNKAMTNQVDAAVAQGTPDAIAKFQAKYPGIKVKEVFVGDGGSTATRAGGKSVLLDADRTLYANLDPDDVARFAADKGVSSTEAAAQMQKDLAALQKSEVGSRLLGNTDEAGRIVRGTGRLTPGEAGYETYGGFGGKAGPADAYHASYAETRMAGSQKVLKFTPGSENPVRVSGQQMVDQHHLSQASLGDESVKFGEPAIREPGLNSIAGQQSTAIGNQIANGPAANPKVIAKALGRTDYVGGRYRQPVGSLDPQVSEIARQIRADPTQANKILENAGMTPQDFATRAGDISDWVSNNVGDWDLPSVAGTGL